MGQSEVPERIDPESTPARTRAPGTPGAAGAPAGSAEPPPAALPSDVAERAAAGLAVVSADGTLAWCNPAFARALGRPEGPDAVTGRNVVERHWASPREWKGLIGRLGTEDRVTGLEVRVEPAGGRDDRWLLASASRLEGEAGEPARALLAVQEITDRREREERLREQAYRDPLTGLANRRFLREAAVRILALAERNERTAGFLYLDLEGFKAVNDTYGHGAGDLLLTAVADRLEERARESDVAARMGGDEFGVLLAEVDDARGARRAGRRLIDAVARPVEVDGDRVRVGVKAGAALYPDHGGSLEELMPKADRALYRTRERTDRSLLVYGEGG